MSRSVKFISIGFALVLLYGLGIFVRGRYGVAIVIHNESGESLRNVRMNVESRGRSYDAGDIASRKGRRIFVSPVTESHISLQWVDASGTPHVETVAGYVEQGYCGNVEVAVLPDKRIATREKIDPVACWRSWFDFL